MSDTRHIGVVYEVNTAVWLAELSVAHGRAVTLGDVSKEDWETVSLPGVDAVWLMGVWERSPAGLAIARQNQELQSSFRETLPDLKDGDAIGSPYCVRRYVAAEEFGGTEGLAAARSALAERGVGLLLDYVPNHVAPDHPWTTDHPDWFVRGSEADLRDDPAGWLDVNGTVLAHGRDPYFPPWPDVVQLDAFSPGARQATIDTLSDIASQCDGIRCDMAMLMTNDVFARTWGGKTGPTPEKEFWPSVISAVRLDHPEVILLAEAYWDMEWTLQQQGFDYCYDKRLYDRMMSGDASELRGHLCADLDYQRRLVRFLENHDEPRVAGCLEPSQQRAAAVALSTLPGLTLWHEGQFEGRRVRSPVFLQRRPDEEVDPDLQAWYRHLLAEVGDKQVRRGTWRLLDVEGWPDNRSCESLLAWSWSEDSGDSEESEDDASTHLVVVNWSPEQAQGRVRLPGGLAGRTWNLVDVLEGTTFERDGNEMAEAGLFVDLNPWGHHLLSFQ